MSEDWSQATCVRLSVDPDVMQPEVATQAEVEDAKALCKGCPLFYPCRQAARDQQGHAYGVWAGMWWGELPAMVRTCGWCGEAMAGRTKSAVYCTNRCKKAMQRAQRKERALSA